MNPSPAASYVPDGAPASIAAPHTRTALPGNVPGESGQRSLQLPKETESRQPARRVSAPCPLRLGPTPRAHPLRSLPTCRRSPHRPPHVRPWPRRRAGAAPLSPNPYVRPTALQAPASDADGPLQGSTAPGPAAACEVGRPKSVHVSAWLPIAVFSVFAGLVLLVLTMKTA